MPRPLVQDETLTYILHAALLLVQGTVLVTCCLPRGSQVRANKRYAAASAFTVKETAEAVAQDFGKIDVVVHSLANGPEVTKPLLETSRKARSGFVLPHSGAVVDGSNCAGPASRVMKVLMRRCLRRVACSSRHTAAC